MSLSADVKVEEWKNIQNELKSKVILSDCNEWSRNRSIYKPPLSTTTNKSADSGFAAEKQLRFIAGIDISYEKVQSNGQCAVCVVVLELPQLEIVYKATEKKSVSVPYVCGYLAFRELPLIDPMIAELLSDPRHEFYRPQVVMLDGNGLIHPRHFGAACQLGVTQDIPCLGVAKEFLYIGVQGRHHFKMDAFIRANTSQLAIVDQSGATVGIALLTNDSVKSPIFVSQGHRLSLETAVWIAKISSIYRIPEPTRQANLLSHQFLRTLKSSK